MFTTGHRSVPCGDCPPAPRRRLLAARVGNRSFGGDGAIPAVPTDPRPARFWSLPLVRPADLEVVSLLPRSDPVTSKAALHGPPAVSISTDRSTRAARNLPT